MQAVPPPRTTGDPYVAAGLVRNPFVAEDLPGVDDAVFTDVGVARPAAATVVELVGCRGAGKTTHLLRWVDSSRYHHVELGWRRWRLPPQPARPGPDHAVAWDEADRLPRPLLRTALSVARRRGGAVLLGVHAPTGLADLSLTMPAPTEATVSRFAARRLSRAALPGRPPPTLPDQLAAGVARDSDGCWWTVGTRLHAWVAGHVNAAAGADVSEDRR